MALLERARGYRAQQEQVLSGIHGIDRAAMEAERTPAQIKRLNRRELLTFAALLYVPIILAMYLLFRRIVGAQ